MIFNRKTVFFNIIKSYFKYFANKSKLFYKNRQQKFQEDGMTLG